ncbi:MAG: DedA family protein [Stellaceae bacterium]
MIAAFAGFIVATISATGYAGIVLLMALESACIPIPSEVTMPFSGYLVTTGRFDLVLVATAGALGCNLGSTVAYAVGAYGGRPLIERWGAYLLIGRRELGMTERFFARFGSITVFIGRLLPVIRTFIALPAGLARMNQAKFQIYTFLGSWPWCFGLAYLGMRLGERWNSDPEVEQILHRFDIVIVLALAAAVLFYIWMRLKHRVPGRK